MVSGMWNIARELWGWGRGRSIFAYVVSALELSDPQVGKGSLSHFHIPACSFPANSFTYSLMPEIPSTGKAGHTKRKWFPENASRTSNIWVKSISKWGVNKWHQVLYSQAKWGRKGKESWRIAGARGDREGSPVVGREEGTEREDWEPELSLILQFGLRWSCPVCR